MLFMQKTLQIFSLVIWSAMLVFASGFSQAQGLTEQELSMQRIQDRMNSIEKNMSTMQQELYRSGKSNKNSNKPKQDDEPIGSDEEKNRAMNGKIEEVEHSVNVLAAKLDKIIADIDFRLAAIEKNAHSAPAHIKPLDGVNQNNPVDIAPSAKPDEVISSATSVSNAPIKTEDKKPATSSIAKPANLDPAAQYEKAFEFLRLTKYDDAERAFKDFIANNKGNELLGNSYYWLGETFYIRENYQQAAVNFLKGYQDYPKGNKAADNLLKLAMSLKRLKKDKEACATLDKMKKEYPSVDKDLLSKANAERIEIKCK
jgi:tol-pal system protein YbgF